MTIGRNIADILARPAAIEPDRCALIVDGGGVCDYSTLAEQTGRWSATLHAAGIEAGDRLALVDWGGVRAAAVTLAAAHLGAATVQLNPLLTSGEFAQIAKATGCSPVGVADISVRGALAEALGADGVVLCDAGLAGTPPTRHPGGDASALVLLTSGTSGLPKAVPISHSAVGARISGYRPPFDPARPPNVTMMCVPSFHVGGMLGLLLSLYAGDTTVVLPRFDAGRWISLVSEHRVASVFVVPTMLARILDHPDVAAADMSSLRSISYGAAAAPIELVERAMQRWPHVDFANVFGQTETLGAYTSLSPADHRQARRIGSVGRPLPGVDVRIVDPATGSDVASGDVGELWVKGAQNVQEGWLKTGDLARCDADGYLYPSGRRSDTINRGGEKFGPGEVADVLRGHPAVADVAVAGVPDREMGERVGVALVLRPGAAAPTVEALRSWCRGRLAPFKLPEAVVVVAALPYNELGKLPRQTVAALISSTAQTLTPEKGPDA